MKQINVLNRPILATLWSATDVFFRQGMQFLTTIILARLLLPNDFGVIAIIQVFTSLMSLFVDGGFSSSLIQKKHTTIYDESTVFFFNIFVGIILVFVMISVAPIIAEFFKQPILKPITFFMSLSVLFNAVGSIHNTLLTKKLEFKIIMKIGAIASFLAGLLAILLAIYGFGVWSIVWQSCSSSLITTFLLWVFHSWRPKLNFSIKSLLELKNFGGYMFLSGIMDSIYNQLYTIIIGKFYSLSDLGYYNRAQTTRQMQISLLESTISRVAFPYFSGLSSDINQLRMQVRNVLCIMMVINIPIMLFFAVLSKQLIVTLFGVKWVIAAPILQVLCLAGILWPLHTVNLNALKALGKSNLFFKIEIIKKLIGFSALICASFFGIIAMAWSQVITGIIGFIINSYYSGKLLNYGVIKQVRDFISFLVAGVVIATLLWFVEKIIILPDTIELFLLMMTGVVLFVMCAIFFKFEPCVKIINKVGLKNKIIKKVIGYEE